MPGYPSLFPSGFLEFQDQCTGPLLYRNQPSRSASGVTLNEYMNKYNVNQYIGGDYLRMANNLKQTARSWDKLPYRIRHDFLKLIVESNSDLSKEIIAKYGNCPEKFIEHFGEDENKPIIECTPNSVSINKDNKMSIFIITVVAIVAVVIGFLIACAGT